MAQRVRPVSAGERLAAAELEEPARRVAGADSRAAAMRVGISVTIPKTAVSVASCARALRPSVLKESA